MPSISEGEIICVTQRWRIEKEFTAALGQWCVIGSRWQKASGVNRQSFQIQIEGTAETVSVAIDWRLRVKRGRVVR